MPEERIEELLEQRDFKQLKLELEDMYPVDLAEIMEELTDKQVVLIFRLLPKEEAAETFSYMNAEMRQVLIDALTDSELQEVMEEMYIDDTVDVLEEMPANVVDRLLLVTCLLYTSNDRSTPGIDGTKDEIKTGVAGTR